MIDLPHFTPPFSGNGWWGNHDDKMENDDKKWILGVQCRMETSWDPFPAEMGPAVLGAASTWIQETQRTSLRHFAPHFFVGNMEILWIVPSKSSKPFTQNPTLLFLSEKNLLNSPQKTLPSLPAQQLPLLASTSDSNLRDAASISPQDTLTSKASWDDIQHVLSATNRWKPPVNLRCFHRQIPAILPWHFWLNSPAMVWLTNICCSPPPQPVP